MVPFFPSFFCMTSDTEDYYFATDIPPESVLDQFPGWKINPDSPIEYRYDRQATMIDLRRKEGSRARLWIIDNEKPSDLKKAWLIPTSKRYLVMVDAYSRAQLAHR